MYSMGSATSRIQNCDGGKCFRSPTPKCDHHLTRQSLPLRALVRRALRLVQAKSMPFQQIKLVVSMRERHFRSFPQREHGVRGGHDDGHDLWITLPLRLKWRAIFPASTAVRDAFTSFFPWVGVLMNLLSVGRRSARCLGGRALAKHNMKTTPHVSRTDLARLLQPACQ